jgi:hypothetical protein
MSVDNISTVVSTVGLVGLVVSLYFLGKQGREMTHQTEKIGASLRASADAAINAMYFQASQVMLEYPQLRAIFYEDEFDDFESYDRALSDQDRVRATVLAEMLLDAMDSTLRVASYGSDLREAMAPWAQYVDDAFRTSRFLCEHVQRRSSWYDTYLIDRARLAQQSRPLR